MPIATTGAGGASGGPSPGQVLDAFNKGVVDASNNPVFQAP